MKKKKKNNTINYSLQKLHTPKCKKNNGRKKKEKLERERDKGKERDV